MNVPRTVVFLALVSLTSSVRAGPPSLPRPTLPGTTAGIATTRWIAPYIKVYSERVGARSTTTVRWFDKDGNVIRDVSGPRVEARNGYVFDFADGRSVIHGLYAEWKLEVPSKAGPAGYVTATSDGRLFLRQYHPVDGQIAVDVYAGGKRVSAVGPFHQYNGRDVQPSAKGGFALLAWKDADKTQPQVIVAGPDGKQRLQIDCHPHVDGPIAKPDGEGVLLRLNDSEGNTFLYYGPMGKATRFEFGPNGGFTAWVAGTKHALFSTSIGHEYRYCLVNYETGKALWKIASPVKPHPNRSCSVLVVNKYILFGGVEYAAVDPENGRIVARWRPDQPHGRETWLAERDGRIFVMSQDQFSEINIDDIAAKTNGWR